MKEAFEGKIEQESEKSATDVYLEQLNPQLWEELSSLSAEQRDERWFELTQKHLKDYKDGKSAEEGFKLEELEFIFLNRLGVESIAPLDPKMSQRGFSFDSEKQLGQRKEKLDNFGDLIATIQNDAEQHAEKTSEPFQILIGGIGISGKATSRGVLSKELSEKLPETRVLSWDRDYQRLFPIPPEWQGDINVIEDVHGLDEERDEEGRFKRFDGEEGLPGGYDMILYVLPTASTFRQNLLGRGMGWLQAGKLDLTAPGEKHYQDAREQKIEQTADELERILVAARKWFREQLRVLRELKNKGVKIVVIEPSEILRKLYDREEDPELLDKSFAEALKILSEKQDKN